MTDNTYKKISLINTFDKTPKYKEENVKYLDDFESYKKSIKEMSHPLEFVGRQGQLVKAYFDIDKKLPKNHKFDELGEVVKWLNSIEKIFNLKNSNDIYILKRDVREFEEGVLKYSYHFIVDNIKITHTNLKLLINEHQLPKEFDRSCYSINQGICPPYADTKIKVDGKLPPFKPYNIFKGYIDEADVNITKYLISYIEKDFKCWDDNMVSIVPAPSPVPVKNEDIEKKDEDDEDNEEEFNIRNSPTFIKIFSNHISHLSTARAIDYNDWLEICLCIINIGEKYKWTMDTIIELCNKFSKKNTASYNEDDNKKILYRLLGSDREKKVGMKRFLLRLKEDDSSYFRKHIIDCYDDVKKVFENEYCIINNPPSIYRIPDLPIEIYGDTGHLGEVDQHLKEADARFQTKNKYYLKSCMDEKGKVKYEKQPFFEDWLKDSERLTYEGIKFAPSGLSEAMAKKYKNLYSGFKADKVIIDDDIDYSNIQPILDHIKIVYCANNEEHYQYVLKWFAKIITDPENRPQVGLVFYSKEHGTGRNTFTNYFQREILGNSLTASCHSVSRIFSKFNNILAKCMFLVIEEASGELKAFMEDMKNLITEPTLIIERKGIDNNTQKNYVNVMLLTNNENVLDIDDKDRRFAIFESSPCMKNNEEYFNKLYDCMSIKKNSALFIKYLREEVDSSWTPMEFQKNRPITKAYKKQQSLNAKNYIKFVSHITSEECVSVLGNDYKWKKYKGECTARIEHKSLYNDYKTMCENFKYTIYPYDKFINCITRDGSGIIEVKDAKTKKIVLLFNKTKVLKWVEIYRNVEYGDIEEFVGFDDGRFENDDE